LNAVIFGMLSSEFWLVTPTRRRQGPARSVSRRRATPWVLHHALGRGGAAFGSFAPTAEVAWIFKVHRWKRGFNQSLTTSALVALTVLTSGPAAATCADVALVLAIDASSSVKEDEFALQLQGYAQAFRSPRVQAVLSDAGIVDIGAVLFSDTEIGLQVLPMMRLHSASGAEELAVRLEEMPRPLAGNTGIGVAVMAAISLLEAPGACAHRRLINLSGDGPESMAPRRRASVSTAAARQRAENLGITINALAIQSDVPDLDQWYRTRLITGPGAFVMEVDGFESFSHVIELKLLREIGPEPLASLHRAPRP
jgi:hypothetical protein